MSKFHNSADRAETAKYEAEQRRRMAKKLLAKRQAELAERRLPPAPPATIVRQQP
jgi:hypothetical protein